MLNQDYKEMLQCFERRRVRHLVVGAYALAAHGFPRSTADIDIWIRPDADNARRVYRALVEFGAPLGEINEQTFTSPDVVYQIGVAPCRIDILTTISGDIEFDEAYETSALSKLGDIPVRVPSIDKLLQNKKATGRARDIADVEMIEKKRR